MYNLFSIPFPSPPLAATTTTTITTTVHSPHALIPLSSPSTAPSEMQLGVTGDMSVVERLQYLLDTGQFADVNIRVGQGNNVTLFKVGQRVIKIGK